MKLFILGATGGTGRHLIQQALSRGHQITALVRSPQKITRRDPKLTILTGNPLNASELRAALHGHEAVISALGPHSPARTTAATDCARTMVSAMRDAEVQRLIIVSGALLFSSVGLLTPLFALVRIVFSNVARDHGAAEQLVIGSRLQWTIARPPYLSDGPLTGGYRIREGGHPPLGLNISRADLAHFLLDVAEKNTYLQKVVGVSR